MKGGYIGLASSYPSAPCLLAAFCRDFNQPIVEEAAFSSRRRGLERVG